jgi:hypothetical protein
MLQRPVRSPANSLHWGLLAHSSPWLVSLGGELERHPGQQASLLQMLRSSGGYLVGYLPTLAEGGSSWLVLVPDISPSFLHSLREDYPGIRAVRPFHALPTSRTPPPPTSVTPPHESVFLHVGVVVADSWGCCRPPWSLSRRSRPSSLYCWQL